VLAAAATPLVQVGAAAGNGAAYHSANASADS
jgi:hypothetical protein